MQKINDIWDKINLTQEPILPNIGHNQQNNSTDSKNSEDNHEESLHSKEDWVMGIPTYENDDDLKNKDEPASQETVEETEKYEADVDEYYGDHDDSNKDNVEEGYLEKQKDK